MANYQSAYTGAQIDTAVSKMNDLLNIVYPVGSIYMSVNATNPETFIGGTWARITDCFLLASGNTYTPGTTGGEANVTLSTNTMPAHTHSVLGYAPNGTKNTNIRLVLQNDGNLVLYNSGGTAKWNAGTSGNSGSSYYGFTLGTTGSAAAQSTGGGAAHNNMPPYLAVYVWQRMS